jgi:hypothetical protein
MLIDHGLMTLQEGISQLKSVVPAKESDGAPDRFGVRLVVATVVVATLIVLSILSAICSLYSMDDASVSWYGYSSAR